MGMVNIESMAMVETAGNSSLCLPCAHLPSHTVGGAPLQQLAPCGGFFAVRSLAAAQSRSFAVPQVQFHAIQRIRHVLGEPQEHALGPHEVARPPLLGRTPGDRQISDNTSERSGGVGLPPAGRVGGQDWRGCRADPLKIERVSKAQTSILTLQGHLL